MREGIIRFIIKNESPIEKKRAIKSLSIIIMPDKKELVFLLWILLKCFIKSSVVITPFYSKKRLMSIY